MGTATPRFTKPHGDYHYARIKAVSDYCEEHYDPLTTVWLSLQADEKIRGEWVDPLMHDDGFRSNAVKQSLFRVRKKLDVDEWAGCWLMSPRRTGYSHRHYALWINKEVEVSDFHSVIDSHVRNHPTASSEKNQYRDAIQIRQGDEVKGLPAEIAHNLPEIGASTDVRSVDEARRWCSMYWFDDRIRFQELGSFREYAEDSRPEREGVFKHGRGWVNE